MWGVEKKLENEKSKEILKLKYRPAPQAIKDMGYSLYDRGILKDKRKKPEVSKYKF